jgi:WD40 repeat protein
VRSLAFSPDGKKLASGGIDGRVLLHDVSSGKLLAAQTNFPGAIGGVAFSADGSELAAAGWSLNTLSGQIKFLAGDDLQERRSINDEVGQVLCMVRSPDGATLVSAGVDRLARFWDFASGTLRAKFMGHERAIVALAYSSDGKFLASSGWDSATKIWNAEGNPAWRKIQTTNSDRVVFSPDGRVLACAGSGLELRDAETGDLIRSLPEFPSGGLAAFSPQGDVLAAVGLDSSVHFWDTQTWRHWMPSKTDSDQAKNPGTYWPDCRLKFSADGRMLVVPGFDGVIRFFEPATGKLLNSIDGGTNRIESVAITVDAKTLFTANRERLDVWDVPTERIRTTFKESGRLLQISKDQRWLASGSYDGGGLKLRTIPELELKATTFGHKETIYGIAFSHDSRLLASASWDGTVKIWHILSGRELMTISSPAPVSSVTFAPDDRTLAFGTFNPGGVFLLRARADRGTTSFPASTKAR